MTFAYGGNRNTSLMQFFNETRRIAKIGHGNIKLTPLQRTRQLNDLPLRSADLHFITHDKDAAAHTELLSRSAIALRNKLSNFLASESALNPASTVVFALLAR